MSETDVVIIAVLALTTIFVGMRVYVKAFLTRSWTADDGLLGISMVSYF